MKTNKYIKILLDNGLNVKTISKLNESQMRVLAEKMSKNNSDEKCPCGCEKDNCPCGPDCKKCDCGKSKKKETKEQATITTKTVNQALINNSTGEVATTGPATITKKGTQTTVTSPEPIIGATSGEVTERFKSTAQQKFFWNKCTKSGNKKSKWCKWANEFQRDTRDKDLPKKLHPEKKVKVKTEGYEKFLEDSIVEMVDRYINPAMTKSQLINTLNEKVNKSESFMLRKPKKNSMFSQDEGKEMKTMKRPIGRMFSLGEDTKEKTRTKPDTDTDKKEKRPGKKNPFRPKHNPAPKAGKGTLPNFLKWDKLGVNLK